MREFELFDSILATFVYDILIMCNLKFPIDVQYVHTWKGKTPIESRVAGAVDGN